MLNITACMDIIVAPLELNNPFTDCKSQLKIFEAAAFGIPCVASPVRSYLSTIVDGKNGFLASNSQEWVVKLSILVKSTEVRENIGKDAEKSILPRHLAGSAANLAHSTYRHVLQDYKSETCTSLTNVNRYFDAKTENHYDVSIVAPLYRKAEEVKYFLDSIYYQDTAGRIELILIDDSCPDDSADIAEKYIENLAFTYVRPQITANIIRSEINVGNCGARNMGINAARGDIVLVVDADGIFDPNSISQHLSAYVEDVCDVAVGIRGIETNGDDPLDRLANMRVNLALALNEARFQDKVVPESFVNCVTRNLSYNRRKYANFRFDETFSYTRDVDSGFGWEDIEFGYRLYKAGARIKFLRANICLHYSHESDLTSPIKPLRSVKNFARLLSKHVELPNIAPGWSRYTSGAIFKWLKRFDHDVEKLADCKAVQRAMLDVPLPYYRRPDRPLRILTHRWHCGHQFELYRLGHKFDLARGAGTNMCDDWEWRHRPMPGNASFVDYGQIRLSDYDLILLHFDENIFHPERCNGNVPSDWGKTAIELLRYSRELPIIAVCHGTPQFNGQYDLDYKFSNIGQIMEDSRMQIVSAFSDVSVVCNSQQAADEWQFKKSKVIWHGFSGSDFPPGLGGAGILAMENRKMRQRPHYNGWNMNEEVRKNLGAEFPVSYLDFPKFSFGSVTERPIEAERRFFDYSRRLGQYDVYLNPTIRSPMPRMRGEAMMTGCIPVCYWSHDVDRFVVNGENGFYSRSGGELAEMIKFIIRNDTAREKMRVAARETALKRFSLDRYLREWDKLVRDCIS